MACAPSVRLEIWASDGENTSERLYGGRGAMGLFKKLSNNKEAEKMSQNRNNMAYKKRTVYCPVKGKVIALIQVADPVFSSGTMGPGVGIEPANGKLYAPVDGTVAMVFPTGHAIGLKTRDGMEILIHIGIDTVSLKGDGFKVKTAVDQEVRAGDLLIEFDLKKIEKAGCLPTTMVLVSNADAIGEMAEPHFGEMDVLEEMFSFA